MTKDQIIQMAREAGMYEPGPLSQDGSRFYPNDFAERFATLVEAAARADERSACAKVIEGYDDENWSMLQQADCAAAIRVRSQS
jgi:hypothetical protein